MLEQTKYESIPARGPKMCSTSYYLYTLYIKGPRFFEFPGSWILANICQNLINLLPEFRFWWCQLVYILQKILV